MAQLKAAGRYKVPTFIIHADGDEIAPFRASEAFVQELQGERGERGIGESEGERACARFGVETGRGRVAGRRWCGLCVCLWDLSQRAEGEWAVEAHPIGLEGSDA